MFPAEQTYPYRYGYLSNLIRNAKQHADAREYELAIKALDEAVAYIGRPA